MKCSALTAAGLAACAAAAWHGEQQLTVDQPPSWTPALETRNKPPIAGFALRPTPTPRVPRYGLVSRENDNDNDDDDDEKSSKSGSSTSSTAVGGSLTTRSVTTSAPNRPSNICGWDKNGGGFFSCSESKASCTYTNGVAGCCTDSDNCDSLPRRCVEYTAMASNTCDSSKTLCCSATTAPHCFTWLISTSTSGTAQQQQQHTYTLLGCADKAGTGTLLPTDPVSSGGSSNGGGGGSHVSGGTIAGAVVGGVAGLALLALLAAYVIKQKRKGRAENAEFMRKQAEAEFLRGSYLGKTAGGAGAAAAAGAVGAAAAAAAAGGGGSGGGGGGGGGPEQAHHHAAAAGLTSNRDSYGTWSQSFSSPGPEQQHLLRDGASSSGVASVNGHSYSVSSVTSQSVTGGGYVLNQSSGSPPPMASVVEAPDTMVGDSGAPVEVSGTAITRESIQNRAELG